MEEQQYLDFVLSLIHKKLEHLKESIENSAKQVEYLLGFISSSFKEMDEQEVAVQRTILENEDEKLARMQELETKLLVQQTKPYFARFDFKQNNTTEKIYLGINNLSKENIALPVVYDWRAPICSMYYDFELGKAFYQHEETKTEGEIVLKRQYKIEHGALQYYFDSSIMVMDEILQEELSKNGSLQMKNIIATIQKEQNQIIRKENGGNLIIQGYAGSGKTSIAMHRVAYMLYKNKNLSSNEIMIISPNKIFSYYISGVLPELGEKNILETTFLALAKKELGEAFVFETREDMVENLFDNEKRLSEAQYKESFEFFDSLKQFLKNFADLFFNPKDLVFGKLKIAKETISKLYYETYKEKTPAIRMEWIADYIVDELRLPRRVQDEINTRVKRILYSMFTSCDILYIYREFLHALNLSDMNNNLVRYEDIAPLMFVKDFMFSISRNSEIKHLVVDEMQDFSPIHFDLFEKMFPCDKTILGDIYQSLFKTMDETYLENISKLIPNSQILKLKKCYRSTRQIMDYASKLSGISDMETIDRNGEKVEEFACEIDEYKDLILNQIYKYLALKRKVAIICPTQKMAEETYILLSEIENILLVDKETEQESADVLVMSSAYSKGLEFDAVIALGEHFDKKIEKNLLYVAATRALHALSVIYKKSEEKKFL